MAFGLLYTCSYWNENAHLTIQQGGNANSQYTTINIYEKDYTGSSSTIELGDVPLKIKRFTDGDNRFKIIKGEAAYIELMATSNYQFADLFTAENYTYLVVIYKGVETDDLVKNRSFLANDDEWTITNGSWVEQCIKQTNVDQDLVLEQTVSVTNGTQYDFIVDIENASAVQITVKIGTDQSIDNISSGRFSGSINYTGANGNATFQITVTDDLTNLHKITHISLVENGTSNSYIPIFVGYLFQDTFIEPEKNAPYPVTITASNGLGALKNNDFETTYGDLVGQESCMNILKTCLQSVNLYLPVYTGIDIYDTDNDSDGDDPISTKWNNLEVYQDMNCEEVLQAMLKCYQVEVKQRYGKWYITKQANFPYDNDCKLYDTYGNELDNSVTVNFVKNIEAESNKENILIDNDQQLEVEPGLKKYDITQEYGERLNVINSYFDLDRSWITSTQLRYWSESVWLGNLNREGEGVKLQNIYLKPTGATGLFIPYIVSPETPELYDSGARCTIKISFEYWAENYDVNTGAWSFYWVVYQPTGATAGWTVNGVTDMEEIELTYTNSNDNDFYKWIEFEDEVRFLPDNINEGIQLLITGLMNDTNVAVGSNYGLTIRNVNVQILTSEDYNDSETVIINANNNKQGDSIDLTIGDVPDELYNDWIFNNALLTGENGQPAIGNWAQNGDTTTKSLLDIIKENINLHAGSPMQILRGSIYGDYLVSDVLKFVSNSNKIYMITGAEWDDKRSTLTGEFKELYYESGGLPSDRRKVGNRSYRIINASGDFRTIN